jgi:uracil-DNA glycosylase family protein
MSGVPTAGAFLPARVSLKSLRVAAAECRGCDLYRAATQTVFGEGAAHAPIMLVGEQPGDAEDRAGHPFVGPAGKLLHAALHDAGLDERDTYVTNAVKHFKFVERGKRRIHVPPKRTEVKACFPWLEAEINVVHPYVVVALGATAAKALLGPAFRLTENRGRAFPSELGPTVIATVHPSSILRAPDDETRHAERAAFVDDLRRVAAASGRISR